MIHTDGIPTIANGAGDNISDEAPPCANCGAQVGHKLGCNVAEGTYDVSTDRFVADTDRALEKLQRRHFVVAVPFTDEGAARNFLRGIEENGWFGVLREQ